MPAKSGAANAPYQTGLRRSRVPVKVDGLYRVFIQSMLRHGRAWATLHISFRMCTTPVVYRNDLAVRGGPLIGAGPENRAQRSRQRREKPARGARPFRSDSLGRARPMITVIPALGCLSPPLG